MRSVLRFATVGLVLAVGVGTAGATAGTARADDVTTTTTPVGSNVFGWGANGAGQRGSGDYTPSAYRAEISGLPPLRDVAAGSGHSLALDETGHVWGWGNGVGGALGPTGQRARSAPVQVPGLSEVTQIDTTTNSASAAVTAAGELYTWGCLANVNLGPYDCDTNPNPTRVEGLPAVAAVAGGDSHWLALTRSGEVWAWGKNDEGRLGLGHHSDNVFTPTRVQG